MEDINEKLKLLNYETEFCKKKRMKPIESIYFAHPCNYPAKEKVRQFYEISYWLMNYTLKGITTNTHLHSKQPNGTPTRSKYAKIKYKRFQEHKTTEDAVKMLIKDIEIFGIRMPEGFSLAHCL